MHDVGEIRDQVEIVLDDEQRGAVRGQSLQHPGQRGHLGRVETGRGLVEQQYARTARQGPGQLDAAQRAGRQPGGGHRTHRPVQCEQPERPLHGTRIRDPPLLGTDADVFGHGQRRENSQLLERP